MDGESIEKKEPRTRQLESCPVCGGRNSKLCFKSPDRLHGTPGEFSYHKCGLCGTVFQNPMVIQEDLYLCYPKTYYTHNVESLRPSYQTLDELRESAGNGFKSRLRQAVLDSIRGNHQNGFPGFLGKMMSKSRNLRERAYFGLAMDELLPFKTGNLRALEIGCGNGNLLLKLKSIGWDTTGVEWDPDAAEIAHQNSGCNIEVGDFRKLNFPNESFDLIVLSHVFEHLDTPKEAIQRMAELLTPGGRIVLIYPNCQSLGARFFGRNWFPWEVPRHLVFLPPRAIKNLAADIGLKIRLRTKSEFADFFSSNSRRYSRGLNADEVNDRRDFWDRMFKKAESLLVLCNFAVGDEIVVSLHKV